PTIVGLHDTTAADFPRLTMPTRRARAAWRVKERLARRLATQLFTVSEAARAALVRRFALRPDSIAIVPEAPDPVFSPRPPGDVERDLGRIGLEAGTPLVIYAAGISPHKNIG